VEAVRGMRSGSIETEQQERFVASYVSLAWKRHGRGEPLIGNGGEVDEPTSVEMEVMGSSEVPDFVVLVGLQGSGKSGFARMCRLRNPNVEVLSPDEIVAEERVGTASAKRACEAAVGQWRGGGSRKVLVLDRCNPTPGERREWTKMFNYSANITAVWFDYDAELCQSRAEHRGLHPTMPPHRVKSAISSTAKLLQPPTLDEGFTGVVRVRCIANAVELANRWFGEVPMRKFVRTRHLLDLGSATRDDLVLDSNDLEGRFQKMVVVEEKVDGANIGFSLDATGKILVQNRSHYISSSDQAQFSKIDWWLERYGPKLYRVLARDEVLKERYVLFGEWMAATHSIAYTRLPAFFLAFDLLDRLTGSFVGRDTLVGLLKNSGISIVPEIYRGILEGREMLLGFLERESLFAPGTRVEGVVVRWQNGERGKVVRENFVAGSEHWSKNEYRKNRLAAEEEAE
jgi:atypical dual specificity phosphatase